MEPNYTPKSIKRPYLVRNSTLSRIKAGAHGLRLFPLIAARTQKVPAVPPQLQVVNPSSSKVTPPTQFFGSYGKDAPEVRANKKIYITILDEDWFRRNPDLVDRVALDFIPTAMTYSPVSTFTAIKALGANNYPYHYGGSEDTLTIKVDWYGYSEDPILKKCRFIESLCKADGWSNGPPNVGIDWGNGPTFAWHEFVITKAPYTIKDFTGYKRRLSGAILDYHLWPVHGTQTITLKRVSSSQLTHKEIRRF